MVDLWQISLSDPACAHRQFFRCSEPSADALPTADARLPLPAHPFAHTRASAAEQSVWEAVWRWLHIGTADSAELPADRAEPPSLPSVASVLNDQSEIQRLGACYALGLAARDGNATTRGDALARLAELLVGSDAHPARAVVQRSAQYGLTAAGQAAVPLLLKVLHESTAEASLLVAGDEAADEARNTAVRALFALGEAAAPTTKVIDAIVSVQDRWRARLNACIADPPPAVDGRIGPLAAWHRGVSVCVHALAMLAGRADKDAATTMRLARLLLPWTLQPDPIGDSCPQELIFTCSSNAAFWISEGAAVGLLRLVGGAPSAARRGAVVKPSTPASQTDQRFVQGLCMLALQRSLAADRGSALSALLSESYQAWAGVYAAAGGSASDKARPGEVENVATRTEWHLLQ